MSLIRRLGEGEVTTLLDEGGRVLAEVRVRPGARPTLVVDAPQSTQIRVGAHPPVVNLPPYPSVPMAADRLPHPLPQSLSHTIGLAQVQARPEDPEWAQEVVPHSPAPTDTTGPTTLPQVQTHAGLQMRYGLGHAWNPQHCLTEIRRLQATLLESCVELGRLLHWAKLNLPHGQFERWCQLNIPFSLRTVQNYMVLADLFLDRPALLEELRGAGIKKALLVAQLDPAMLTVLEEGSHPEINPELIRKASYEELRAQTVEWKAKAEQSERTAIAARAETERVQAELAEMKKRQAATQKRLHEVSGVAIEVEADADRILHEQWEAIDRGLSAYQLRMDGLARRYSELSPALQARIRGMMEALVVRSEAMRLRHLGLTGTPQPDYSWKLVLQDQERLEGHYPMPASLRPVMEGEDE